MTYAHKVDGAWITKTPRQFRNERNASIPDANLEAEGLSKVTVDPKPDASGQIVEKGPIEERLGLPYQTWLERDPKPEEVEEARTRKQREVVRAYEAAMQPISDAFPAVEREGWSEQTRASNNVKRGQPNPLIDALRRKTGQTAKELADEITTKRAEYQAVYGQHTGTLRGLRKQIKEATTLADLDAIDIQGAFTV